MNQNNFLWACSGELINVAKIFSANLKGNLTILTK